MNLEREAKTYWEKMPPRQTWEYCDQEPFHLGGRLRKHWIEKMLFETFREKAATFLDVGCAEGYYVRRSASHVSLGVGTDFSRKMLKRAKENSLNIRSDEGKTRIDFVLSDAEHLPFRDKAFDVVLCSEVLEHLMDWRKCVDQLTMTCREHLIVSFPPHTSPLVHLRERIRPEPDFFIKPGQDFFRSLVTSVSLEKELAKSFRVQKRVNSHAVFCMFEDLYLITMLNRLSSRIANLLAMMIEKIDKRLDETQNKILEIFSGSIVVKFRKKD